MRPLIHEDFEEDERVDIDNAETLWRPQGLWRFLTALEKPQPGDLGRLFSWRFVTDRNWTEYTPDWGDFDHPGWEFIRPIDEQSTKVPLIETTSDA